MNKAMTLRKYLIITISFSLIIAFFPTNIKNHLAFIRRIIYKENYDYRKRRNEMEYRAELGSSTWALLHIMASKYSYAPSEENKKDVYDFIFLLAKVFSCEECRVHFTKMITEHPPELENHDSFVNWLCVIHNKVNSRLGKKEFDCRRHDERWDCGCN